MTWSEQPATCEVRCGRLEMAYPASKLAAENELRESGLNWSIQRLGFVHGDRDGHLESVPKLAINTKWHPAMRMSMIQHRDIANAMNLALRGRWRAHRQYRRRDANHHLRIVGPVGEIHQAAQEDLL